MNGPIEDRRMARAEDTTKVKLSTRRAHASKRAMKRFSAWLSRKAERIEDNGNPNRAASMRAWWKRFGRNGA